MTLNIYLSTFVPNFVPFCLLIRHQGKVLQLSNPFPLDIRDSRSSGRRSGWSGRAVGSTFSEEPFSLPDLPS